MTSKISDLFGHFATITDPRSSWKVRHHFEEILVIALCAVICGAEHWTEVEDFGKSHQEWFQTFLELPNGIPSHDTFGRVFSAISSVQFEACFIHWMQDVLGRLGPQVVAIDGKRLRGSYDRKSDKAPIQMVSAWACENHVVLGQIKVDEDTNEIPMVPRLLKLLALKGCIVTLDALHCQKETAQSILDSESDYVFSLKENQPTLFEQVEDYFDKATENVEELMGSGVLDFYETSEKGHGRTEVRRYWSSSEVQKLGEHTKWPGLRSIVMVERERTTKDSESYGVSYYISSCASNAELLGAAVRAHWKIENQLHWSLDVTFREDQSRIRMENAAENMSILRRISLNLLKNDSTKKSIRRKRMLASWDHEYLTKLLNSLDG